MYIIFWIKSLECPIHLSLGILDRGSQIVPKSPSKYQIRFYSIKNAIRQMLPTYFYLEKYLIENHARTYTVS